jgi:pentatricopeptide repeat protein
LFFSARKSEPFFEENRSNKGYPTSHGVLSLGNLLYRSQGKYDEALELYHEAEKVLVGVHGHEHLDVAATYNNIANVYLRQGKHDLALEYYQKDLEITVRIVGHAHPDVATTKFNLGLLLQNMGREVEGKEMFKEAATIFRKLSVLYL